MRTRTTHRRWLRAGAAIGSAGVAALTTLTAAAPQALAAGAPATATPIQHVVVIFQENVSFDHYFGTYPNAANTADDKVKFTAKPGTPQVDGLTPDLLQHNPNKANPKRLGPAQAVTCDQGHEYKDEQLAFDGGKMDQFIEHTDRENCTKPMYSEPGLVMDYYDGNTVTALWNYAQRFAMSDNSFGTTFGPSTPGALNLISGQTHGGYAVDPKTGKKTTDPKVVSSADANGIGTVIEDPDPAFDDCANTSNHAAMTGRNIGDLLTEKKVSWGWFQGGFRPTTAATDTTPAVCATAHANVVGASRSDYNAHHEPFEYYRSTANPHHLAPKSVDEIGHDGQANHQYDLGDFDAALNNGTLPAVSYLKAANYQDGHAGYSDPLDEQKFVVDTVNKLQQSKDWASTAVVIAYDDSDGWYDHKFAAPVNGSQDAANDVLNGAGQCGNNAAWGGYADRCGYGPRLPLLVLSPYAKSNFVDHTLTDQSSILRFVEDNWKTGRIGDASFDEHAGSIESMFDFKSPLSATLLLDPATGQATQAAATSTPTAAGASATASASASASTQPGAGAALASTGSNTVPVAVGAAVLCAVGAGVVHTVRRKGRRRA
ncbi:phospholipase C [Streptomyces sp. NRRL WC-3742]|uniref:phospholipase C n=1 Tax=Streptomyces sp. NRRL WC-3742 TaxID=1463934 RepID=UPI0004C98FFF|nr:alkaline phosphatase family protein [Streptomyces sp. NRRL WC-3742]